MPVNRLIRVLSELTSARDIAAVTGVARTAARELTGADGVTIVLRDRDHCVYADEDAIAPLWKGRRFPITACVSGWAMLHGQLVIAPDVFQDPRVPHDVYRPTFVKSLAMVPVGSPDPIAAIGAYWASPHKPTDGELSVLTALAEGTGLALTNVRLFDELRTSLAREREARLIAEAATAAKDEFLAVVTHELRQPLHASLAALRLMKVRASRGQGERAREIVERQIQQMNRLVEDLLDAARIVRGHVKLDRAPLDLRTTLRQVVETIGPLISERGHAFDVQLPSEAVRLDGDDSRLQQVFMNLLTNAAKYTDPGGRIALRLTSHGVNATVAIEDSGRGIDPVFLPRVFDLFSRQSSGSGGFGVGLPVARKLVELHGGSVEARSDGEGHGSVFIVRLPVEPSLAPS